MARIVITGASRGIGKALASALEVRGGFEVVAASRESPAPLDLASFASIDAFVASQRGRAVDVLVNNAGAMFAERALTADGVERTLAVNCIGPLRLAEALAPARVVNVVTSPLGKLDLADLHLERGFGCFSAYLSAKLAFMHVVRAWAVEGRNVQSVHPGMVRTAMLKPPTGPMRWMAPLLHVFADPPQKPAAVVESLVVSAEPPRDALFAGGKQAAWSKKLSDPARNAEVTAALRRIATSSPT